MPTTFLVLKPDGKEPVGKHRRILEDKLQGISLERVWFCWISFDQFSEYRLLISCFMQLSLMYEPHLAHSIPTFLLPFWAKNLTVSRLTLCAFI
jgi:hypothetical protein